MTNPGGARTVAAEQPSLPVPKPGGAATTRGTLGLLVTGFSLALLFVPPFVLDPSHKGDQFWLGEFAKYLALAILALSVDLVWGYTGLLSLGQGLFFGLGIYMAAYSLTLQKAAAAAAPREVGKVVAIDPKSNNLTIEVPDEDEIKYIQRTLFVFHAGARTEVEVLSRTASTLVAKVVERDVPQLGRIVGVDSTSSSLTIEVPDPEEIKKVQTTLLVYRQDPATKLSSIVGEVQVVSKDKSGVRAKATEKNVQVRSGDLVYRPVQVEVKDLVRRPLLAGEAPPQFMQYTGPAPNDPSFVRPPALKIIAPLGNIWLALALAVLLPTVLAALFGLVTFRLRIRGVYFALVTQALLLAIAILVTNQQRFTGGIVGIKDLVQLKVFDRVYGPTPLLERGTGEAIKFDPSTGLEVEDPLTPLEECMLDYRPIRNLNYLAAGVLVTCLLLCAGLMRTKFGKILTAIRDNENRVLALGYNTAMYKTFVFTFAAALAGLAGGLFVTANRVCDSQFLSASFSIEAVIWVAVGGRGTLLGAVVGAILVGFGQSYISSAFPLYWPIILGALFVIVVLFFPQGLTPMAGRGALCGVLLGALSVNFLEQLLGLSKAQRAIAACPVILLGVFLPRIVAFSSQLLAHGVRNGLKAWRNREGAPLEQRAVT